MCTWGTDRPIYVIRRNQEGVADGWHPIAVDACIADYIQVMNDRGIITVGCCCGHGKTAGNVLVAAESIPLLLRYGYRYGPCEWDDLVVHPLTSGRYVDASPEASAEHRGFSLWRSRGGRSFPGFWRGISRLWRGMFNSLCWYLNRLHLSWFVAGLRIALWLVLRPLAREKQYAKGEAGGYRGWVEVPLFGVLAFRTPENTIQFRW